MSKHTEGPWNLMSVVTTRDVGDHELLTARSGMELVVMKKPEFPFVTQKEYEKIILLMKSAPEMLELLANLKSELRVETTMRNDLSSAAFALSPLNELFKKANNWLGKLLAEG